MAYVFHETTASPTTPSRGMVASVAVITVAAAIGMTLFKWAEEILFPDITGWQSHDMTIVFAALTAGTAAALVRVRTNRTTTRLVNEAIAQRSHVEEEFNHVLDEMDDLVWATAGDGGRRFYANPAVEKILGYDHKRFDNNLGFWLECIHPDDREIILDSKDELFETGFTEIEFRFVRSDGQIRWLHARSRLLRDEEGAIVHGGGIMTDITERKEAEQRLRESEERHRALFETMAQGVVHQDAVGNILSVNPAAEGVLGLAQDKLIGQSSIDPRWKAVHEDGSEYPAGTHPAMVALRTGKKVLDAVIGIPRPGEKKYRWLSVNAVPLFRESEENPYQVYTTLQDITERRDGELAIKRAHMELEKRVDDRTAELVAANRQLEREIAMREETEEALRIKDMALASSNSAIAFSDLEERITYVNQAFLDMWGYDSTAEVLGRSAWEFTAEKQADKCVLNSLMKEKSRTREFTVTKRDGTNFDVQQLASVVTDKAGTPICFMGAFIDITERKRTEEELRRSNDLLQALIDSSPAATFIKDLEGRYIALNDFVAEVAGRPREELIGLTDHEIFPKDMADLFQREDRELLEADQTMEMLQNILIDGVGRSYLTRKTLLRDSHGKPYGICGFATDITSHVPPKEDKN